MFTDLYELKMYTAGSSRSGSFDFHPDHIPMLPTTEPVIMPAPPCEEPKVNVVTATLLLCCATAFTYLTADNLVSSLNGMVEHSDISKEWVTFIIIPIISNAAEHTTAAIVASKGKFDLGEYRRSCFSSPLLSRRVVSHVGRRGQLYSDCPLCDTDPDHRCVVHWKTIDLAL